MNKENATFSTQHTKLTLFHAPNSPFARKCRVVMLEKNLQNKIELFESQFPHDSAALLAVNPLARIPALVLGNGEVLCESPVICEYLDSLSEQNILFPVEKKARFNALGMAALGSGIMDSAVSIVLEKRRPSEKQYEAWIRRKEEAVLRTITVISKLDLNEKTHFHIGTINIAVALAYVSFRLPYLAWRNEYKNLSNWLDFINKRASMLETTPIP